MRRFGLTAGVLAVAMSFGVADARRSDGAVQDYTTFADGSGNMRILFRVSPEETLANVAISRATLRFQLQGAATDRNLRVRVHPVTASWNAGSASWDGWTTAGGDIEDDLYVPFEVDLSSGSGWVEVDMTPLLKEQYEKGASSEGFLLMSDPGVSNGLASSDASRFAGLANATIDIRYRELPSAGPPERR
ncbi:MAG TPA: DNRLRE domain-containing protein [bacterium]|nr:DNRLRE domain-containing protein [bacterium]